jgi:hypothetical protein
MFEREHGVEKGHGTCRKRRDESRIGHRAWEAAQVAEERILNEWGAHTAVRCHPK